MHATVIHQADDVGKCKGTNNNGLHDLHESHREVGGKESIGRKGKSSERLRERDLRGKAKGGQRIKTEESVKEKDRRPGF